MHHLIQGIDVDPAELYTELDPESRKYAIVACATIYLHSMNGMVTDHTGRQAAGRESEARPPCLPMELFDTSAVEYVSLVASHKAQLRSAFNDEFPQKVRQQQELVRVAAKEPALMMKLQSKTRSAFSKSWSPCGSRLKDLEKFSAGLATAMPTTSRVEGDFSPMNSRRNSYCSAMTDFSLEGVMYSKQYDALQRVAPRLQWSDCYKQYTRVIKIDTETGYTQYTGIFKIDTEMTCYRQYTGGIAVLEDIGLRGRCVTIES
jgi:hypothetical protein